MGGIKGKVGLYCYWNTQNHKDMLKYQVFDDLMDCNLDTQLHHKLNKRRGRLRILEHYSHNNQYHTHKCSQTLL